MTPPTPRPPSPRRQQRQDVPAALSTLSTVAGDPAAVTSTSRPPPAADRSDAADPTPTVPPAGSSDSVPAASSTASTGSGPPAGVRSSLSPPLSPGASSATTDWSTDSGGPAAARGRRICTAAAGRPDSDRLAGDRAVTFPAVSRVTPARTTWSAVTFAAASSRSHGACTSTGVPESCPSTTSA